MRYLLLVINCIWFKLVILKVKSIILQMVIIIWVSLFNTHKMLVFKRRRFLFRIRWRWWWMLRMLLSWLLIREFKLFLSAIFSYVIVVVRIKIKLLLSLILFIIVLSKLICRVKNFKLLVLLIICRHFPISKF
jgi:hypothetical protein